MVGVTVADAAQRLGVDASRIRQMLRRGDLAGERLGRTWIVDASELARLAQRSRPAGRPLSSPRAWALLDLLDGGSADWLSPQGRSQVRAYGRGLSGASAERWRAVLHGRSIRLGFQGHSAAIRRLVADGRVVVAGAGEAADMGFDLVVVGGRPEVYVREEDLTTLVGELALRPVAVELDVLVRVPRQLWPFTTPQVSAAALAADLLESDEPRAVTAGISWFRAHVRDLGGRRSKSSERTDV